MLALQILIDGFAISALYGLGAVGFTLMFGVCGVLNLAHGGIMLIAALFGWWVAAELRRRPVRRRGDRHRSRAWSPPT